MKVSLIIAVYKDVVALDLIIQSLKNQTYKNFEVIIAEDGKSDEMAKYIATIEGLEVYHLTQEDVGWRKNKMLNKAIKKSSTEYLIFIDGDCLLDKRFIAEHVRLKSKKTVLCGRRTEPGELFSDLLRAKKISLQKFLDNYITSYFKLKKDNTRHYEEGIYCNPNSWIGKLISLKASKKEAHLVGCHWSCNKDDILEINGFDEDFELPTTGEDTDIERRMRHFGIKMKSCRNFAVMVHLYHKKNFNQDISNQTQKLMETKKDEFVCKNGIIK